MNSTLSVRSYCLAPTGEVRRLTSAQMKLLHLDPCPVVVDAFAGCSIRFAEILVRMVDRKPADIERVTYTLIRFAGDGRPDMERYRQESGAATDLHLDFLGKPDDSAETVIDMRSTFQGMGCRWKPRPQEAMELERAALGLSKVKGLSYSDATFALEGESPIPRLPGDLETPLPVDPDNLPFEGFPEPGGHLASKPDRDRVTERQAEGGTPIPPSRPNYLNRLQALHRQQPMAAAADVTLGRPLDLVVLATKSTGANCRLLGRDGVLTFRTSQRLDVVPGHILTVKPARVWAHNGHTYLSGEPVAVRFEFAALGLVPLALDDWGPWDPMAEYWGEECGPRANWAKAIRARGPRPSFELEACVPGCDPEDWDSDPIHDAIDLWNSCQPAQALRLLEAACQADLRCLDAHAHLGSFRFDHRPDKALLHYEAGVRIGQLSLGPDFDGVLPWGCLDNRPFLRCMHGYGLCLWRLGRFREAKGIFERMLWLNPSDNQGVRFVLPEVRAKRVWEDFAAEEEGGY